MNPEYFHLIDGITDINAGVQKMTVEASLPRKSSIFGGHVPDDSPIPGVLLIDSKVRVAGKVTSHATLMVNDAPFVHPDLCGPMETMAPRIELPLEALSHG